MLDPYFFIHSLILCLFIGELSPLILSNSTDQWLLAPVILPGGSVCVFPFFELSFCRVVRCLCYVGGMGGRKNIVKKTKRIKGT